MPINKLSEGENTGTREVNYEVRILQRVHLIKVTLGGKNEVYS